MPPGNILAFKLGAGCGGGGGGVEGEEPGPLCFSHLAPSGLVAKISDFHPGFPDSIPGQGTEISLQGRSLLSLRDQD